MPKSPRLVTKQALSKPLGKINFLGNDDDNDILLDRSETMFTSESSLMKATKLATDVKILVNADLKKLTGHSDWTVVLKKIPVGTFAETVHAVLSEFGTIKLIKMQLEGLWQKTIIEFEEHIQADFLAARSDLDKITWDKKDHYRVLL
ncbi:hypothetical protein G9A89_012061 [Geosiphon pyriformis]|nr:hypothetical protein G9A89_012061 [Geosiphon pyriformis]